jgi:hypothetical protein
LRKVRELEHRIERDSADIALEIKSKRSKSRRDN